MNMRRSSSTLHIYLRYWETPNRLIEVVKDELKEVQEKYKDDRRTDISKILQPI